MLGIDQMHKANFTGKGMTIAVFDGGFTNVDINKTSVFPKMTILGTYNFVAMNNAVYGFSSHGANVLSVLAAYRPNEVIGAAFEASYYLFITENDDRLLDDRIEEFNWLAAAERADSLGVDIINSSLGYNYFKNPIYNYKMTDLNGKTSVISQAASNAAAVGMLVVSSAGNIFEPEWTKIKMPADADSILAVGSVDAQANWVSSSLLGNTTDNRVKPDIATMGSNVAGISTSGFATVFNGTSYASPLAAGLAAGLWQANPKLTAMQLLNAIRRSSSQYFSPNEKLGYGIPNYTQAMNIAGVEKEILDTQNFTIFPNPINSKDGVLTLSFDEKLLQEDCIIYITDSSGKKIFATNSIITQKNMFFTLQNLAISQGVYLLSIEGKKFKALRKLIVY
jgi:subtilisin family serine protease